MEEEEETAKMSVTAYIKHLSEKLHIVGINGVIGNELELIALIRNCQFLYDKTLQDFKNVSKKNEAWEAIASTFGDSIDVVQSRWKSLRDMFSKYKNNGDKGVNNQTVFPYYDALKFLGPHIVARKTSCFRHSGFKSSVTDLSSDEEILKNKDFSFKDLRQFIMHIKNVPFLYDHKYSSSYYTPQKIDCWLNIAKTFGIPVKECLYRWKTLREKYSRERRNLKSGMASQQWELYEDLSFLDEHVRSRKRTRSQRIVPSNPIEDTYVVLSPTPSISLDSTTFLNEISAQTKKEAISNATFFHDLKSSPMNEETQYEINISNCESIQDKANEDDLFGQTIAAELKKIPCPRKKIKLKAEIYRILYEHTE